MEAATTPPPSPALEPVPPAGERRADRSVTAGLAVLLVLVVIAAALFYRKQPVTPANYVLLSILLFTLGAFGVLVRRNALVLFMCIELMLNATNLAFVAFSRMHGRMDGQAAVLFVMIVAAAEVAVGLAIIVSIYRRRQSANVDDVSLLKW